MTVRLNIKEQHFLHGPDADATYEHNMQWEGDTLYQAVTKFEEDKTVSSPIIRNARIAMVTMTAWHAHDEFYLGGPTWKLSVRYDFIPD